MVKRVAVIGSGITGMGCAWWLHECGHEVTVYAGGERVGGHSHTVLAQTAQGQQVPVDTGFTVWNEQSYPNLMQLFGRLKVPMLLTDMSFAASLDDGRIEYAFNNLFSLLAQPSLLLDGAHWRMLRDLLRFARETPRLLQTQDDPTLGHYLEENSYSKAFVTRFLLPLGSCIWATPGSELLNFPARNFVRCLANHGLLQLKDKPRWFTVPGGSIEYIRKLTAGYVDCIRPVAASRVRRHAEGPIVEAEGSFTQFDEVVFACHADEALRLLADPTREEKDILGSFRFQSNRAVLHQDVKLMPRRGMAWASWNYMTPHNSEACLTSWMNQLQDIPDETPLFVSLNPPREPENVLADLNYDSPIFDQEAVTAQPYVGILQGQGGLWYCGAWTGYGFHEDGLSSGLTVAEHITGMNRPWQVQEVSNAAYNTCPKTQQAEAA